MARVDRGGRERRTARVSWSFLASISMYCDKSSAPIARGHERKLLAVMDEHSHLAKKFVRPTYSKYLGIPLLREAHPPGTWDYVVIQASQQLGPVIYPHLRHPES